MERDRNKKDQKNVPFYASLQVKYTLSYFIVFVVVLILINTYPVAASQEVLFSSKRDSLKSQALVMASALMELETLSADQVSRVMNMLGNTGLDQVLVTDPSGLILYDSTRKNDVGNEESFRYALYQEIVTALSGNDVFYSRYQESAFHSCAVSPIVYRGMVIGAIYIQEIDEAQGELLLNLQQHLRNISLIISAVALTIAGIVSKVLTSRIAALLAAIRIVGEGEYGHRLQVSGKDEMEQLAREFNQLTDRLQTTEEVRRRFVADASHELKTPLASIRLLTDSILQNDEMDHDTLRDFVADIGTESERLTRITEHLLALTKLDSLPAPKREPVDVVQVLERAVNMLVPVAEAADVKIETYLKEKCVVACTSDELYQIGFNLIENAIKYNIQGGRVMVSAEKTEDQVLIEVADTGVGIPENDMAKVFNRFYRVDKARSRAAGGTGLGLSIVRDTARRHGGWVTVRRRNPVGSIFTVGLPQWYSGQEDELT